jgi:nucleoside-diphosphate-sugar epimerase
MWHAQNIGVNAKGISRTPPAIPAASSTKLNTSVGDVNDNKVLSSFYKSIDIVIDCASSLKPAASSNTGYLEEAILLDKRIQLAATEGISKYVYISSGGALYPATTEKASETSCLRPSSKYGLGKQLCETIIQYHSSMKTLPILSARTSNPYGYHHKSELHGFINIFIRNMLSGAYTTIYGDPKSIQKDYIYIDDCSDALLLLALHDTRGHNAVNVGHGSSHSLYDIMNIASSELDMQPLIKLASALNHDKRQFCLDTDLLNNVTSFKPRYSLTDGIRKTIEWENLKRSF